MMMTMMSNKSARSKNNAFDAIKQINQTAYTLPQQQEQMDTWFWLVAKKQTKMLPIPTHLPKKGLRVTQVQPTRAGK